MHNKLVRRALEPKGFAMSQDLPIAALVATANDSETAMTITMDLADFERIRGFTDIKRQRLELIRKQFKYVDADANRYWRTLEQLGMWSIIFSENSKNVKPIRFLWHYNMKEVVAVALGDKLPDRSSVVEVKPATKAVTVPKLPKLADKPSASVQRILKHARQNERLTISKMSTDPKRMEIAQPFNKEEMKSQSDFKQGMNELRNETRASASYTNEIAPSEMTGYKTVIVSIRDGEVDIEVKIPSNLTLSEVDTLSKVLRRKLSS
jgi:hypothetical protein